MGKASGPGWGNFVVVYFGDPEGFVIPKRGFIALGIYCFAADRKQIPRR
jgi:hypothetical protein